MVTELSTLEKASTLPCILPSLLRGVHFQDLLFRAPMIISNAQRSTAIKGFGTTDLIQVTSKSFPRHMAHRPAPISVFIALGHAAVNAVKATAGGGGPLVAPRV